MRNSILLLAATAVSLSPAALAQSSLRYLDQREVAEAQRQHAALIAELGGAESGSRAAYVQSVGRRSWLIGDRQSVASFLSHSQLGGSISFRCPGLLFNTALITRRRRVPSSVRARHEAGLSPPTMPRRASRRAPNSITHLRLFQRILGAGSHAMPQRHAANPLRLTSRATGISGGRSALVNCCAGYDAVGAQGSWQRSRERARFRRGCRGEPTVKRQSGPAPIRSARTDCNGRLARRNGPAVSVSGCVIGINS